MRSVHFGTILAIVVFMISAGLAASAGTLDPAIDPPGFASSPAPPVRNDGPPVTLVVDCGPPTGTGDPISANAFYIPNFPADRVDWIGLEISSLTMGPFTLLLEARENSFDGPLIAIAHHSVEFTDTGETIYDFPFFGAPFPRGQIVTFRLRILETTNPDIFFDPGPCGLYDHDCTACSGAVIETDGIAPPLGTFRRNSTFIRVFSMPCTINCVVTAPEYSAVGHDEFFWANAWATDCAGPIVLDWNFGDGSAHSDRPDPQHAYAIPGVYTWTCTASIGSDSVVRTGTVRVGTFLFAKPDGSGTECGQGAPCSLQTALSMANDGDTVVLAPGTYTGTGTEVAKIEKTLALVGGWDGDPTPPPFLNCSWAGAPAPLLDGEGARRVVSVKTGTFPAIHCVDLARGKAVNKGAGILAEGASLSLHEITVDSCTADSGVDSGASGGGLFLTGGSLLVYNGTFIHNVATCGGCSSGYGGAIFAEDATSVVIGKSTFTENDAPRGAGVRIYNCPFSVTDCTFQRNGQAGHTVQGGGFYAALQAGEIRRTLFDSNDSLWFSGGADLAFCKVDVTENTFVSNRSDSHSALEIYYGEPFLANNIFADNVQGTETSSALYLEHNDAVLSHNTFARNTAGRGAGGTALGAVENNVKLVDNIFAGNGVGLFADPATVVTADRTLWGTGAWANGADMAGPGTVTRTMDSFGDPLFAAPDAHDYHIAVGSAAVDAAINVGVLTDVDGERRPSGGGYDIGADELAPGLSLYVEASATPTTGIAPVEVAFTGFFTGGAPYYTFAWDFGDGGSSSEKSPHHTYTSAGVFHPVFTVFDGFGATASDSHLTVTVVPPCSLDCQATAPPTGIAEEPLAFAATAIVANCSGSPTFLWDFGDGTTSTEQNPTHAYFGAGTFGWSVKVEVESQACIRRDSVTISPRSPGDCDGDDAVSIGEVQKAINMFLGSIPPDCGVDCSGDGTVSIGEVQKVINGFLGIPTSC